MSTFQELQFEIENFKKSISKTNKEIADIKILLAGAKSQLKEKIIDREIIDNLRLNLYPKYTTIEPTHEARDGEMYIYYDTTNYWLYISANRIWYKVQLTAV
jgi:hypothetical protein